MVRKNYFHLLAALRGIAAILVVEHHTGELFSGYDPLSFMAVDLFFLLSGVVIDASYGGKLAGGMGMGEFAWVRMLRIYPLYFLGSAFTVLTLVFVQNHHLLLGSEPYPIRFPKLQWIPAVVMLPFFAQGQRLYPFNNPAWSLFFELAVNFIYARFYGALSFRRLCWVVGVCGAGLLLAILSPFPRQHGLEIGWSNKTFLFGFFRAGFSFFLGVILYRLYCGGRFALNFRHPLPAALAVLLAATACLAYPVPEAWRMAVYLFGVYLLFPVLIYISLHIPGGRLAKFWDWLGDVSYPIYMVHLPCYILLSSVFGGVVLRALIAKAPWSGIGFEIVIIALAYLAGRYFDAPVRRALQRAVRRPVHKMVQGVATDSVP